MSDIQQLLIRLETEFAPSYKTATFLQPFEKGYLEGHEHGVKLVTNSIKEPLARLEAEIAALKARLAAIQQAAQPIVQAVEDTKLSAREIIGGRLLGLEIPGKYGNTGRLVNIDIDTEVLVNLVEAVKGKK